MLQPDSVVSWIGFSISGLAACFEKLILASAMPKHDSTDSGSRMCNREYTAANVCHIFLLNLSALQQPTPGPSPTVNRLSSDQHLGKTVMESRSHLLSHRCSRQSFVPISVIGEVGLRVFHNPGVGVSLLLRNEIGRAHV